MLCVLLHTHSHRLSSNDSHENQENPGLLILNSLPKPALYQRGSFRLICTNNTKNIFLLCPHLVMREVTLLEQPRENVTAWPMVAALQVNAQPPRHPSCLGHREGLDKASRHQMM